MKDKAGYYGCSKCHGNGLYQYPNSGTWHCALVPGMIVMHAFTEDVCDKCWGTGDEDKPGKDPSKQFLMDEVKSLYKALDMRMKEIYMLKSERDSLRNTLK